MPGPPTDAAPHLSECLRRAGELSHDELLTLLTADMHRRWRAGNPMPVEAYLDLAPSLRDDPDLVLDLIATEAMLAEQAGRAVGPDGYAGRYPDLAAGIARRFALMNTLADDAVPAAAPTISVGPDGAARPGPPPADPFAPTWTKTPRPAGPDPTSATESDFVLSHPEAISIPGFAVLGELGRGGMGVVYHAWQYFLNRPVAIKMVLGGPHADTVIRCRFLAEAEAIAALEHPNVGRSKSTRTGRSTAIRMPACWPRPAAGRKRPTRPSGPLSWTRKTTPTANGCGNAASRHGRIDGPSRFDSYAYRRFCRTGFSPPSSVSSSLSSRVGAT